MEQTQQTAQDSSVSIGCQTSQANTTVYTTFAGTESYWPSQATTAFVVDEEHRTTPAPTQEQAQSITDLYFVPAIAGLFDFVAIIGAVIILKLRKRP